MQDSGTAIANAAANVRMLLVAEAAKLWEIEVAQITTDGLGAVVAPDGRHADYGSLASKLSLHVSAIEDAPRRDPNRYRTMGRALPRRGRQLLKVDMGPAGCLWNGAASSAEWRHRANGQLHVRGPLNRQLQKLPR
jgi:hypothetical protein